MGLLARTSTHLDVFAVGFDGTLLTNWWDADSTNWWNTNNVPPQSAASGPAFGSYLVGANIGATTRSASQLDVFAIDPAGKLTSSWWNSAAVCADMDDEPNALPAWVMTPCWQNQPWLP